MDTLAYIIIILVLCPDFFDSRKELNAVAVVKLRSRSRSGEAQDPINKHLDSRSRTMFTPAALVLRNRLEDGVFMRIRNVLT